MSETTNTTIEKADVKPYTLRGIQADDLFPMLKILRKIGLREIRSWFSDDETKNIINEVMKNFSHKDKADGESGDDNEERMVSLGLTILPSALDIADIILGNIEKCETDIYNFLANLSCLSVDEIRKFPLVTFTEMIFDIVEKEDFKDFIKVVSKRFK